jgi:hypothetical protein
MADVGPIFGQPSPFSFRGLTIISLTDVHRTIFADYAWILGGQYRSFRHTARVQREVLVSIELIAVDDGSTDDSGEILDELASEDARIWCLVPFSRTVESILAPPLEKTSS